LIRQTGTTAGFKVSVLIPGDVEDQPRVLPIRSNLLILLFFSGNRDWRVAGGLDGVGLESCRRWIVRLLGRYRDALAGLILAGLILNWQVLNWQVLNWLGLALTEPESGWLSKKPATADTDGGQESKPTMSADPAFHESLAPLTAEPCG
jgi:hypothetical protein